MPGFLFEQTVRTGSAAQSQRLKIRNVTLKTRLHARRDIPVLHTARQIYDGVC